MDLEEILSRKKPTDFDKLTCFIYSQISMLHSRKVPIEDMKKIKESVSKIIRKNFSVDGKGLNNGN